MRPKLGAVVLVILDAKKVHDLLPHALMVTSRKYGGWCLPGGKVDEADWKPGSLEQDAIKRAARRELLEETGLYAGPLVWLFTAPSVVESSRMIHTFIAREVQGSINFNAEVGTQAKSFAWLHWPAGPFDKMYREQFPDGISHFKATEFQ